MCYESEDLDYFLQLVRTVLKRHILQYSSSFNFLGIFCSLSMDKKVTNLDHIIVLITLLFECSGPDFTRLVHKVHAEELARTAGLVPGTDVRLGGNTGLGKVNFIS